MESFLAYVDFDAMSGSTIIGRSVWHKVILALSLDQELDHHEYSIRYLYNTNATRSWDRGDRAKI